MILINTAPNCYRPERVTLSKKNSPRYSFGRRTKLNFDKGTPGKLNSLFFFFFFFSLITKKNRRNMFNYLLLFLNVFGTRAFSKLLLNVVDHNRITKAKVKLIIFHTI